MQRAKALLSLQGSQSRPIEPPVFLVRLASVRWEQSQTCPVYLSEYVEQGIGIPHKTHCGQSRPMETADVALQSWMMAFRNRLQRRDIAKRRSAKRHDRARAGARLEHLETRTLLTTAVQFFDGGLVVFSDGNESIEVGANNGQVSLLIDGNPDQSLPVLQASALTSIRIEAGSGENRIDVRGVTTAVFSSLVTLTIDGGNGNDTIIGSVDFPTDINGGHGNDTITGGSAADTIKGGDGRDSILAGAGNDVINAGDGHDFVNGEAGNDDIDAGDGQDTVFGDVGNDTILGGDGLDSLMGDDGDDEIHGDHGNDVIDGGLGDDRIFGGADDDQINGNIGNDVIFGGGGNDVLQGSDGDDRVEGGTGNDTVDGGAGNDLVKGDQGDDLLDGSSGNDDVRGGGGNDLATGGDGDDRVAGQGGHDTLAGGQGSDTVDGGAGNDRIDGRGVAASITDVVVQEGSSGITSATLVISLLEPATVPTTFQYATSSGTALSGSDFVATAATVIFAPGDMNRTITIGIIGDTVGESDESFFVDLSSVDGTLVENGRAQVTILDDDVTVSVNNVTLAEGAGATAFNFTVSLSTPSTVAINVPYTLSQGTALAGQDFVAASGVVTVQAGTTTQQLTVMVNGDGTGEDDERFFVNLQDPMNAAIADGQGIGVILDDDGGPPLGFPINFDRFAQIDMNRWSTTATDGTPGFTQGDPVTLTWGIVPDGTQAPNLAQTNGASDLIARLDVIYGETATGPDVTNRTWFALFQSVFDRYSEISGMTYQFEPNDDGAAFGSPGADGVLGIRPDIRIGGRPLDGDFGVLAFNFFPDISDMVIDTNDIAFTDLSNNSLFFRNVLSHEHGHGLGQPHVHGSPALLNPFANTAFDGPQEIDILSTQRSYGDPDERGTGNDTVATATLLGTVSSAASVVVTGNSIDDDSDIDVYGITVLNDLTLSIDLTPTGSILNVGPQDPMLDPMDINPGTTFNAQTLSDLGLELVDSNGVSVLATSFIGGYGQSEQIVDFVLPAAGTYFVRVTGTDNATQAYTLSVSASTVSVVVSSTIEADSLNGGDGNDTIFGSQGDDTLAGDHGNDILHGGGGNDLVRGGAGNDTLFGDDGDDTLRGQGGTDILDGGLGNDSLEWNGAGADVLIGNAGADFVAIDTGNANDTLSVGQDSADQLTVTVGSSTVTFESTTEYITLSGGSGVDVITIGDLSAVGPTVLVVEGGRGNDRIDASGMIPGRVRVQLNGNDGNDRITGSAFADAISGGNGDDTINAGAGNDLVTGDDGAD